MSLGIDQIGGIDPEPVNPAARSGDRNEFRDSELDLAIGDIGLHHANVAAAALLAGVVAMPNQRQRSTPLFTRGAQAAASMLTALGRTVRMAVSTADAPVIAPSTDEPDADAPKPGHWGGSRMDWLETQACAFLATFGLHGTARQRRPAEAAPEAARPATGGSTKSERERWRMAPALASMEPVKKVVRPQAVQRKEPARGWRVRRTLAWCSSVAGAGLLASLVWAYVLPSNQASDDEGEHAASSCSTADKRCRR
jgi:hypothetical protein